ncbi:MAG: FAD-dependent oxidoreductase, partial [Caldilineaceae bacterium]|nr:FAD-dependent oxidoreductase [Caldilineaceae bacterium]
MRTNASIVIVGAGIAGCSAAYHLTQLGWKDVVVVDKGPLFETGGSTSHAPGLIFQTNYSKMMTAFARYTVELLKPLHYREEQCLYQVGGIEVAHTPERWAELHRKQGVATSYGVESHLLSPAEVKALIPIIDETVIRGGFYVPTDSDVRGWYCAAALAALAEASGGAEFYGHVTVQDIQITQGRARGVVTDLGTISCDQVLLCTNVWASVLADKAGVRFPIMGVEHQYAITEPLAALEADRDRYITHPILRHQDYSLYYRQHGDAYGVGNYRHPSILFDGDAVGARAERAFRPEQWNVCQQATEELLPALRGKRYVRQFNGFMAFSNDLFPIIGETALNGLWAALGIWVTHSGGAGKAVAELLTFGESEWDIREADINRFHGHDYTRAYMAARVDRQYQEVYDIIHPLQQMEKPRNVRLAPFHQRLVEQQ